MANPSAAEAERVLAALPETRAAMDADSEALLFALPDIVAAIGQLDFRFQQTIWECCGGMAKGMRRAMEQAQPPRILNAIEQGGGGISVDHRRIAAMVNEDLQAAFANTQPHLTAK